MHLNWDAVIARSWRVENISHIAALLERIAGHLGEGSALERIVRFSASHVGDVTEEPGFGELERELMLIESNPDAWVRECAHGLSELIGMARHEQNPIVFV
ncbi:MAG: hypothetical protein EOR43_23975 [Mesorhizobium sp.]|uniref:hypothetical protein n=1 Tax=Mesorhizobium sp. TaxID=1871066 RepID=UPI000FE3CE20|nr:hypothetical protein [Mesorhizobium sp.]RWK01173.1 MAG: hypothetical protein EOR42_22345 [Mesorhizobium sp.]RWK19435.1 MAG: hypothetical protein EOR43_23975 [Mesorhizobium sp.]RWK28058.1 MAG: hypothetical protein EOR44_24835 [Mesorhizobium sp.]